MFKKTLLVSALLLMSNSAVAVCKSPLLDNYLQPTSHLEFIQCKVMPNQKDLTIFLIPSDAGPSTEIDLDILVVNESGTIVNMDKIKLLKDTFGLSIDTVNYKLNSNDIAFGVDINNGNYTNRTLYIMKGQDLIPVASDIGVELNDEDSTIKRSIDIGKMDKSGFSDLIVKEGKTKFTLKYNESTESYDVPKTLKYSF
jgi:hypothetical protein